MRDIGAEWPGWVAFGLGMGALLLAMVHLWAGPSPRSRVSV